jgi:hypothetical protein
MTTAQDKVTDLIVGKLYRCQGMTDKTDDLFLCFRRYPADLKGKLVVDPTNPTKPPVLEVVEVPSAHCQMVSVKSLILIPSRLFEFHEVPVSEQDSSLISKTKEAFAKKNKLADLKEKLDAMTARRQQMVDTLADLQHTLNQCTPAILEMDLKIKEAEEKLKQEEEELAN